MTDPRGPALLIDLVTNTLDPGYAAAAARRGGSRRRRWYDTPAVVLGCLLIGFLLVVSYSQTHRAAPTTAKVHAELVNRVASAERAADALERSAQALSTQVVTLRDSALSGSGKLRSELAQAEVFAGTVAVHGPGVQVVLGDPPSPTVTPTPGRAGTTPISATHIITDRDVRSVVNELWADGAEAIGVNGIRLTPLSAIRFAGEAVLVDFQPVASPYTITAIGNSDRLLTGFVASAVASRYQTLTSAKGVTFSFDEQRQLQLPGTPAFAVRYAKVAK